VYLMLPVSLDCSFFIVPSAFSNIYSIINKHFSFCQSTKIYTNENKWNDSIVSINFICRFVIQDLSMEKQFLLDVDINVCFEVNGPCMLTSNILKNDL
jgi:hypothetical protein